MTSHSEGPPGTTPLSHAELQKLREQHKPTQRLRKAVVAIYSRDGVLTFHLADGDSVTLGRAYPADVQVRDATLSRQHACFELVDGEAWVEDLQSTNGTWMDGERVERRKLESGADLVLGAVPASFHLLGQDEIWDAGLEGHDRFLGELHAEVVRSRVHGHTCAVMMVRTDPRRDAPLSRWYRDVRSQLRAYDRMALYGASTVEILLPEATEDLARRTARRITELSHPLLCGLAAFPAHARSAEELVEVTWQSVREANWEAPIHTVPTITGKAVASAGPADAIVHSAAMKDVFSTARRASSSDIPVLVLGPTGVGKELVARAIHTEGSRGRRPFIAVNCAALPAELLESELFGHERGAFTGAERRVEGVFEAADKGTVFLDEIGELPPAAQAALLRVLESKRFTRVGSTREIEVDVRVVAATHRDLEEMSTTGGFRSDLLYRLNVLTLRVPSLRERADDVEPLALHFLEEANRTGRGHVIGIEPRAMDALRAYPWPGNVRELKNAIQRASVLAREERITVEDLPERIRQLELVEEPALPADAVQPPTPERGDDGLNLKSELQRYEHELITDALQRRRWDRKSAAKYLGLPLRTLAYRMQQLGIRIRNTDRD